MNKDKAIEEAMASIENRIRHVYNQGFEDGYTKGKEQTDEIRVGDEVIANDRRQVVTAVITPNRFFTINLNGQYGSFDRDDIQKVTGRHFPQINEVLKQMRGEER